MAGTFARTRETKMDKLTKQLAEACANALHTLDSIRDEEIDGSEPEVGDLCDHLREVIASCNSAQLAASMDAASAETSRALRDGTLAGTAEPHTPEPWGYSYRYSGTESAVFHAGDPNAPLSIAETCNKAHHANARRIVACINACAGMSTEQLEELDNGQLADIGHYWLRDS